MILVGNQRGGARQLAEHLLNDENDHVEVHELHGFIARDLSGALDEAHAISRGTKCRQYLFSLSLNPPPSAKVPTRDFEGAIERIEKQLGLTGQPRAIVFHEKEGRRHAHAVWSRIKADDVKAVQLSFTKKTLMRMARDLYLEHGWTMPRGLVQSEACDPRNFTLAQWQQARRQEKDPRAIKIALQDAWAISDTKAAFSAALRERGYWLACGDRRGFVALDRRGEAFSLSRWIGIKGKQIAQRLGDVADLPGVSGVKGQIADEMRETGSQLRRDLLNDLRSRNMHLRRQRKLVVKRQRDARRRLRETIEARKWHEACERQARVRSGLRGLWDWARGETVRIRRQNEADAQAAERRDRNELDTLIFAQIAELRRLVDLRDEIADEFASARRDIQEDIRAYDRLNAQTHEDAKGIYRRRLKRQLNV